MSIKALYEALEQGPAGRTAEEFAEALHQADNEYEYEYVVPEWMCSTCGAIKSAKQGLTYLVQRQGWVKIGFTNNLNERLRSLRRRPTQVICPEGMDPSEPLLLLVTLDYNAEHLLHETFSEDHVAGEWFLPGATMTYFIQAVSR